MKTFYKRPDHAAPLVFGDACSREHAFAHLMIVLSWNLMCRISNAIAVQFCQLDWIEDALGITYAKQKNDQFHEKGNAHDPRHIYANPYNPEICPILALGLYWLLVPVEVNATNESLLFPGKDQDDWYRKILQTFLSSEEGKKQLAEHGLVVSDIGSHSTRKGSSTFVSSGSTSSPSSVAIAIRAGWTMGGVEARYLRYVGRRCFVVLASMDFRQRWIGSLNNVLNNLWHPQLLLLARERRP